MSANCELPLRDVCMWLGGTIAMYSAMDVNSPTDASGLVPYIKLYGSWDVCVFHGR